MILALCFAANNGESNSGRIAMDTASFIGRQGMTAIRMVSRVGKIAEPARTRGYIAIMSQPSPIIGFLLAVVIEPGGGLLRMLKLCSFG
jgi:hypothetical protein